ncbi:uncharacterized protein LOC134466015 [Engraulis encrasicolus]|uniref:uncharacterized protein LOC134466015 n=1 Tax=Engraulis encrasicolus TaxID=184585 RepID=UPI002FD36CF0
MKSLRVAILLLWLSLVVITADDVIKPKNEGFNPEQPCQPDIHMVLREVSVQIAEQQVELRQTKEQLQAVEKRAEAVESRLRASEKTVEEQRVAIKELREKQKEQASTVVAVGGRLEELRRDREASRVSFSAALGDGYYGPLDVTTPLIFTNVITNVGNAYNVNTGVFTAPVRGVYHFVLFVFGDASSSTPTGASLHHNGKHVVVAYAVQVNPKHVNPANGASLLLEVGDVILVKLWHGAQVRDTEDRHTTFSGHLLFTLR